MKTNFFSRYGLGKDDQDKVLFIQGINDSLFSFIENDFIERKSLLPLKDDEIRNMVKKMEVSIDLFMKSLNYMYWMIMLLARHYKDNPKDFSEDIQELYPECVKDKSLLTNRIIKLSQVSKNYVELVKIDNVKDEGLPALERTSTTVVIKPVFEERFDFENIDIKDYKPIRIKKTACAIIEFKNSYKKYFAFQVDSYRLEKLINELIALQIELKTFEDECN